MLRPRVPLLAEVGGVVSATASASGTSTAEARGQAFVSIQSGTASASGTSTAEARGAAVQTISGTASASGTSTAAAKGRAIGVGGASVPTKFARWASYQRRPGTFIRQVSPGVYLRATKEQAPVVVVNDREIGPAEDVRGERLAGMLAQGLDKRDARKIRKILRRLDEPPEPVEPVTQPKPPKSAEAEKLILQVNAAMPKRTVVMAGSIDEEIAALVALGII